MPENDPNQPDPKPDPKPDDKTGQVTMSQAEFDKAIDERLKRERAKYADYDELKRKAEGAKTSEDRIAALEKDLSDTRTEALRRRIQAKHKISDEDADLFLTAVDEDGLEAQAKRLAERNAEDGEREVERKKKGNKVPREGGTPKPGEDEMRTFARDLFGRAS